MRHLSIEIKKLQYIYDSFLSSFVGLVVLVSTIFYAYYDVVDNTNLMIWYFLNIFLLAIRGVHFFHSKKTVLTKENFSYFYWSFFTLSTLTATLWGASAFIIFPTDPNYQIVILMLLFGLVSASTVSYAPKLEIAYTYIFAAVVPYSYVLFMQNNPASSTLSFSLGLYIFILVMFAKKVSFIINKNLELAYELQEKVLEANSANRAKSDFLSVMSHEIRTPLNAIIGFVQILLKKENDTKKIKYLNTIQQSSKVLTNVINDILDISKIESGKLVLESVEFNAKEEFQTLFFLFEQNAKEKNVTLLSTINENIPDYLQSDILRLKQILSNLLSNAIKFTPEGKNIEFCASFNTQTNLLRCEVRDEGIGIAKENMKQITEAFTQADSSTARKYGGSGLGLSIVTKLLALFETELKIESKIGEGSSFSFDLPVQVSPKKIQVKEEALPFSFVNKKVLVAEDNKTNQMLIKILLEELDIEVAIADDGLIAEKMYENTSYDMVLMDINMPNKNGTEALLSIRAYEKEKNIFTPIIALTANAVSGDEEKYIEQGFDAYLAKPIDDEKLLLVLKKYLSS